jgi:hypothetical protein
MTEGRAEAFSISNRKSTTDSQNAYTDSWEHSHEFVKCAAHPHVKSIGKPNVLSKSDNEPAISEGIGILTDQARAPIRETSTGCCSSTATRKCVVMDVLKNSEFDVP